MMVGKTYLPLLIATAMSATPAAAQGVFNMGGLTQTLSIPTKQRQARDTGSYRSVLTRAPARRAAAAAVPTVNARTALSFRRDPALSERLKQRFLSRFEDPKIRAEATRNWRDATPKIMAAMKPTGMQYNNLADAQATYIVTMWQATHRQYTDNPAQFRSVSRQFTEANLRAGTHKISNAEKQEMAEMLIYEAMFIGGLFPQARTDKELARGLVAAGSAGSKNNFGFDVAKLRMTPTGIAP